MMKKKFLMKIPFPWDTEEALYNEIVPVKKGYALVESWDNVGVMKTRGFDLVEVLKDYEEFDFDTQEIAAYGQTRKIET